MKIKVDDDLMLELVTTKHAAELFVLADANRKHLRPWFPWVDAMQDVSFMEGFTKGCEAMHQKGEEHAFAIFYQGTMAGRIGVYRIDHKNKIGEIGYWIGAAWEGKGIVSKACQQVITHCFDELKLNRIEIRCRVENLKSQALPMRLGFVNEGVLHAAEHFQGKFFDLQLFALCQRNDTD